MSRDRVSGTGRPGQERRRESWTPVALGCEDPKVQREESMSVRGTGRPGRGRGREFCCTLSRCEDDPR